MRAAQLERQIAAVRQELARALDEYRELGLQVSLLARQRDVAQRNLARTEQYLQSVQPGAAPLPRAHHPGLETATASEAPSSPGQARTTRAARRSDLRRKPRWRRAVDTITSHAVPVRQRERELAGLQQQLASSQDECVRLEARASRLEHERDQALVDLELARARALAGGTAMPVAEQLAEESAPPTPPDIASVSAAFQAVEEKLQRAQRSNNDIQIALAERDDEVAALRSEREQLQREMEQLDARVSALQQELAAARESSHTLQSELGALHADADRTASRDAEKIAALQQRIIELEAQLEDARQRGEALERNLQASADRQAAAEQERTRALEAALAEAAAGLQNSEKRREALAAALQEEQARLDARDRQLAALQAHQQQLAAAAQDLKQQVSAAEQSRTRAQQEAQVLKPERDGLVAQLTTVQLSLIHI